LGGWMERNALRAGDRTLSTDVALDIYYFKAGGVMWYRSQQDFPAVMDDLARRLGLRDAHDYPDTPAALEPRMMADGLRILVHDPVGTIVMTLRSLVWLAVVPDRANLNELLGTNAGATSYLAATGKLRERIRQVLHSPLLTALVIFQILLSIFVWIGTGLALGGIRDKSKREAALVLIPFGIALAMIAMASGAEAIARYRMPAIPLLAMLAGIGWASLLSHGVAGSSGVYDSDPVSAVASGSRNVLSGRA